MPLTPSSPAVAPALLTIPQVAARLGVHRDTVYSYIAQGHLAVTDMATGITKGGSGRAKTRIREDVLAAFIDARTRVVPVAV